VHGGIKPGSIHLLSAHPETRAASWARSPLVYVLPYAAILLGIYALHRAWIAVLVYQAGMLAVIVADPQRRAWRPPVRPGWVATAVVVLGVLAGPAFAIAWPWLGVSDSLLPRLAELGLGGAGWGWFLVSFSVINPVLEELFWRGGAGGGRVSRAGDLLFAGYHVLVLALFLPTLRVFVAFAMLWLAARLWRLVSARTGNLIASFISHEFAAVGIASALWDFTKR
jgi:hypothetical protein